MPPDRLPEQVRFRKPLMPLGSLPQGRVACRLHRCKRIVARGVSCTKLRRRQSGPMRTRMRLPTGRMRPCGRLPVLRRCSRRWRIPRNYLPPEPAMPRQHPSRSPQLPMRSLRPRGTCRSRCRRMRRVCLLQPARVLDRKASGIRLRFCRSRPRLTPSSSRRRISRSRLHNRTQKPSTVRQHTPMPCWLCSNRPDDLGCRCRCTF
jgi:hypothetical protein